MTAKHLTRKMKDGTVFEVHPCVDASMNFTTELWRDEIKKAMKKMSSDSIWQRFSRGVSELSEQQLNYLTDIDGKNKVAWCAVIFDNDDMKGIGLSRYIRLDEEQRVAEFAITIIDEFQHQGVGKVLLEQLIESAKENGLELLRGYILPSNKVMLGLCREKHATCQQEDNYIKAEISLITNS